MPDDPTITARFDVPMRRLFDFRDWLDPLAKDMSAEQKGSQARVTALMARSDAREQEAPPYARRVS